MCVHIPVQASSWQQGLGANFSSVLSNEYLDDLDKFKAGPILVARARGANCFDFTYYAKANPDLKPLWTDVKALWRHWVYHGQFDYRPHK